MIWMAIAIVFASLAVFMYRLASWAIPSSHVHATLHPGPPYHFAGPPQFALGPVREPVPSVLPRPLPTWAWREMLVPAEAPPHFPASLPQPAPHNRPDPTREPPLAVEPPPLHWREREDPIELAFGRSIKEMLHQGAATSWRWQRLTTRLAVVIFFTLTPLLLYRLALWAATATHVQSTASSGRP
jgi:hypothetical protein